MCPIPAQIRYGTTPLLILALRWYTHDAERRGKATSFKDELDFARNILISLVEFRRNRRRG
jgi:hypothetical protein